MEKIGYIEIKVNGRVGGTDLSPDNYDIRDIMEVLQNAEALLYPNGKKDRPMLSYHIEEGSVKHILKTAMQAIITFNALIAQVSAANHNIDLLEAPTAKALEFFQDKAKKQDFQFEISTSLTETARLFINKSTKVFRSEAIWVDAELYLYGDVQDMGGKAKANIHLDTRDFGILKIEADKKMLAEIQDNLLYKSLGIRAFGKQNVQTGEFDKSSLRLLEIITYNPKYQPDYLQNLINKAKNSWAGVADADEWLQTMRGYGN